LHALTSRVYGIVSSNKPNATQNVYRFTESQRKTWYLKVTLNRSYLGHAGHKFGVVVEDMLRQALRHSLQSTSN